MKQIALVLALFLVLAACQITSNCSSDPVSIKLVSHSNFIFYYKLNQNCSQVPAFDYCQLASCEQKNKKKCYRYEVYNQYNETACKERCCFGMAKVDKKLFEDFGCNAIEFVGKSELQKRNSVKLEANASFANSSINSTQNGTNNNGQVDKEQQNSYSLAIFISCWAVILVILLVVCICKCYNSFNITSDILNHMPEAQINTERALSPIKSASQLKEKIWQLPDKKDVSKEVQLLKQECVVCLNGQPNSTLECGHGFHKVCISQWLQNTFSCPLCKSKTLNQITIRCNKCLIYRYQCSLGQLKASFVSQDICGPCSINQG